MPILNYYIFCNKKNTVFQIKSNISCLKAYFHLSVGEQGMFSSILPVRPIFTQSNILIYTNYTYTCTHTTLKNENNKILSFFLSPFLQFVLVFVTPSQMGSCMTTVAYISTALCIQAGLQCIISTYILYIAQNTIYLKFNFSLPILNKISTESVAIWC